MRIQLTLAAVVTVLASGLPTAQDPWNDVKSWTGTVTIEATGARSSEIYSQKITYKATGKFTITDGMMPEGMHMMWPMASAEEMADPKKAEAASLAWQAQVVASLEGTRLNSSTGASVPFKCAVDTLHPAGVGLGAHIAQTTYTLQVTLPTPRFTCSGSTTEALPIDLGQTQFELTGPRGKVGPVSDTKTFTTGLGTIKVSYTLAPVK